MIKINDVIIEKDAEQDLLDGKSFYDKKGLHIGSYFWDTLLSEIESLYLYAGIHEKKFEYYKMLSKKFPFAIYYDIDLDNKIAFVDAVLPIVRDPQWISEKLKNRQH